MRNVPPRPDNYAQRGGRAGCSTRMGVVLSYTRNTPHDGYFFDKPGEMIAGEVRSPGIGLGDRDIVVLHLNAIAFGGAEPGLSGRMGDYITVKGELIQGKVDELVAADDRSPGHPMRRSAEFGILPGYELPAEPCTARLLNDENEEEAISVERTTGTPSRAGCSRHAPVS